MSQTRADGPGIARSDFMRPAPRLAAPQAALFHGEFFRGESGASHAAPWRGDIEGVWSATGQLSPSAAGPLHAPELSFSRDEEAVAVDSDDDLSRTHATLTRVHKDVLLQMRDLHQAFSKAIVAAALEQNSRIVEPESALRGVQAGRLSVSADTMAPDRSEPADQSELAENVAANLPERSQQPSGARLNRSQLEMLAAGKISSVFGPQFAAQDSYPKPLRPPQPPLLLIDRVVRLEAEPASKKSGTIWTETDVVADAWYRHHGRMPMGLLLEAMQGHLILTSWLGFDLHGGGDRSYRVLGYDFQLHRALPEAGETLRCEIHHDGHFERDGFEVLLWHCDCRIGDELVLTLRNAQSGLFTASQLANAEPIIWSAEGDQGSHAHARQDPPACDSGLRAFSAEQVAAFCEARPIDCFGYPFRLAGSHTRTPRFQSGDMRLIDSIPEFDPKGGPWQRGYLRAQTPVTPNDWFFASHFHNDPCMPASLVVEAGLQAMAFYLAALGFTLNRDGWRFEPVQNQSYRLELSGEIDPAANLITYEVFVAEVIGGPRPTLHAELLCTVDGRRVAHISGMQLALIPDWPFEGERIAYKDWVERKPVAKVGDHAYDYPALLSSVNGRPSGAFGPFFACFDDGARVLRLPGEPFRFMSRVTHVDGKVGSMAAGIAATAEYDIEGTEWYFAANGSPHVPIAVLMEIGLQPCGWISNYAGFTRADLSVERLFRNLDGTFVLHRELPPGRRTLVTRAELISVARAAGTIILKYKVTCSCEGEAVFVLQSTFGFFPVEAFANQVGLPSTDDDVILIRDSADAIPAVVSLPQFCDSSPAIARPPLLMLDRITGYWPEGGAAGLGRIRAVKDVDPSEWFFKAHFFQDPVQPGSLGIEAMLQLAEIALRLKVPPRLRERTRFMAPVPEAAVRWKYRGQVTPIDRTVTTLLDVLDYSETEHSATLTASASLWVEDKKIYELDSFVVRLVNDWDAPANLTLDETLSLETDPWIVDHSPTFVVPALPMTFVADRLARAALRSSQGRVLVGLDHIRLNRWISFARGPVRLRAHPPKLDDVDNGRVTLEVWREANDASLSRFDSVAEAVPLFSRSYQPPPAPLQLAGVPEITPGSLLYEQGFLFHGPTFQAITELRVHPGGVSTTLTVADSPIDTGVLNFVLLDGMAQTVVAKEMCWWSPEMSSGVVAYPAEIERLDLFAPVPRSGIFECRAVFNGFADGRRNRPRFIMQLIEDEKVCVEMRLTAALFGKGPVLDAPHADRMAFVRDRLPRPGISLSRIGENETVLSLRDFMTSDFLPGTNAAIYRAAATDRGGLLCEIAAKDHVAALIGSCHPSAVHYDPDRQRASLESMPLTRFPLSVKVTADAVTVQSAGPVQLDAEKLLSAWKTTFSLSSGSFVDFCLALVNSFARRIVLTDPTAIQKLFGKPCLILANHQCYLEGFIVDLFAPAIFGSKANLLVKIEHQNRWLGQIDRIGSEHPKANITPSLLYFDRNAPRTLPSILADFAQTLVREPRNLVIFVEGTRAMRGGQKLTRVSSALIDVAITQDLPIIPLRISGGLPMEPLQDKVEIPHALSRQDFVFGAPIQPDVLRNLPLREQRESILDAINGLPPGEREEQLGSAPGMDAAITRCRKFVDDPIKTAMVAALFSCIEPSEETKRLQDALVHGDKSLLPDDPWLARFFDWLIERTTEPRGRMHSDDEL